MAEILDNIEEFKKIDKSDMYSKVFTLPDTLEKAWKQAQNINLSEYGNFDNIVISGMGGSAMCGDISRLAFTEQLRLPVLINRSYSIPNFTTEKTLFIAVSYSGNTEETLSAFDKALKNKCKIISISSGGRLEELSKNARIPNIKIPSGYPPRAALGYLIASVLYIFHSLKIVDGIEENLIEAISILKKMRNKYAINEPAKNNEIKQLVKKMKGKIPLILSCIDTTYASGLRLKTQLSENSKITSIHVTFPELNHNDLVNFSFLKPDEHNFLSIMLRDNATLGRMTRRIEVTKSLVSANLKGFNEIWSQGKSKLARILSLVMYGDFISVYLAVLNGIDPTPVAIIEQLKKELTR